LTFGYWPLTFGYWPLAVGLWLFAFGCWPLVKKQKAKSQELKAKS